MASASYTRILAAVRRIPRGRVATYGLVARVAGYPGQPRLAGYALRHADADVPWHRVLNARGEISARADPDAIPVQRARLEAEGIAFNGDGRVDLARYLWRPWRRTP